MASSLLLKLKRFLSASTPSPPHEKLQKIIAPLPIAKGADTMVPHETSNFNLERFEQVKFC